MNDSPYEPLIRSLKAVLAEVEASSDTDGRPSVRAPEPLGDRAGRTPRPETARTMKAAPEP